MPKSLFTDTLTQNVGETDADFSARIQQYIIDQQYYYESVGGSWPANTSTPNGQSYLGFPPEGPVSDKLVYDSANSQFIRQVGFAYDNTYYAKFLGTVPPLTPPSPLPSNGEVAMFVTGGSLAGTGMIVDTSLLTIDVNGIRFTDAADAVDPQDLVTLSQLTAYVGGTVNTVNTVSPTAGNIQLTVSNSGTGGTLQWNLLDLQIPTADTDTTGLLSDTDWDTFNGKQPAGNYITALTGDGTAIGPGSSALTLATVNSNIGTFGSATKTVAFTVNGKGLITAATEQTVTPASTDITGAAALTRVDDTNVTLTLGGTPSTALLRATSLTLGWTGQLAVSRGGTGVDTASANTVFAGPTGGGALPPAFRALVAADIPNLSSVYQPLDSDLTAIAALTSAANKLPYATGAGTWAMTDITAFARSLLDDATNFNALNTLGGTTVGKSLFQATDPSAITFIRVNADNSVTLQSAANFRTDLSLVIGTNVQAWDADLDTIAALTPSNDDIIQRKAGAWTNRTVAQYYTDLQPSVVNDAYFTVTCQMGSLSPVDATTYYMGISRLVPTTTAANMDFNIGQKCALIGAVVSVSANTTAGTAENITMQLRNVTQATSSSVGTFQSNGGSATVSANFTFTGLNISVASSDFIAIQFDCPTWVTNPVATRWDVSLIFKRAL